MEQRNVWLVLFSRDGSSLPATRVVTPDRWEDDPLSRLIAEVEAMGFEVLVASRWRPEGPEIWTYVHDLEDWDL
jgi:hypothetical protein